MSYFFNEAARIEHLEHVAYYKACQIGLGARYLSAFVVAMGKVCESPDRYRVEAPPNIRRYRVPGFLTTSSIGLWVQMLKFWSLPRIVGVRATGWAGFNWLIDLTCAGRRTKSPQVVCYAKNSGLCTVDKG